LVFFDHLITLFARERNSGESVSPICFAAFKLITNSNFVGCCTGKSDPHDEISLVGEQGGERRAIASIPSADHPLMDSTDGVLVSSVGNPSFTCL
jgi:hypothetical protein